MSPGGATGDDRRHQRRHLALPFPHASGTRLSVREDVTAPPHPHAASALGRPKEAERPELRCGRHNLELNTLKTVEMIVDFRRHPSPQLPLTLSSRLVSTVETFKFLGITISQDLKWATNINSVLKKAQQRMYFLRLPRKHGLPPELLRQFYTAVVESVLCSSITVWFGAATKKDKLRLQRTIKTAERIVGTPLPTLEDLHAARTKTRACKILSDPAHPGHQLFQLLPSDRLLRCPCNDRSAADRIGERIAIRQYCRREVAVFEGTNTTISKATESLISRIQQKRGSTNGLTDERVKKLSGNAIIKWANLKSIRADLCR
ncbi:uncharacterized protein LOC133471509 isoform X2 [Phyllopteryx taeniolatus]|uniref:uncharacterized protein LOC133471509 isoform X2 n=1 Tax=Phyllopteryx taeniolatus TaxID=161469 RepID=UPI002AD44CEA|nr:uncharacterized protein LOC133471509 isoform X2 [Phyllopteryx taeniolatus]